MGVPDKALPASVAGVCDVVIVRGVDAAPDAAPDVLFECAHGATRAAHFDGLRGELRGGYDDSLRDFFFVNTDVGSTELALAAARRLVDAQPERAVCVVRCLLPRTFVDFNRKVDRDAVPAASKPGEMTPGLQPWVQDEGDRRLLLDRYFAYRAVVERAFAVTVGAGGVAVFVHTYAPRSIDVAVDERIGERLRAAASSSSPASTCRRTPPTRCIRRRWRTTSPCSDRRRRCAWKCDATCWCRRSRRSSSCCPTRPRSRAPPRRWPPPCSPVSRSEGRAAASRGTMRGVSEPTPPSSPVPPTPPAATGGRRARRHRHRTTQVGASPGTISPPADALPLQLSVFAYGPAGIVEKHAPTLAELRALRQRDGVLWLDVVGLGDVPMLQALGQEFGLHRLALEDAANVGQRAKAEDYDDHALLVLRMIDAHRPAETEQLALFVGDRFVVSVQEREGDCFHLVRQRLRDPKGQLQKRGADYLAYALLDAVVDAYFPSLERLDDRLEAVEAAIVGDGEPRQAVAELHAVRRALLELRCSTCTSATSTTASTR